MKSTAIPIRQCTDGKILQHLKNECTNLYDFQTEEELYQTVEEFAYATYNHVRPHSYNGYRTPYQARWKHKERREPVC